MLERKVAKVGLVTTRGFRDTLELGRRTRPRPYGMTGTFEPLIPRERRIEIDERMNVAGEVVVPLDEAQLKDAIAQLLAMGCESLVIHFLHAYANPAHELRAGEIARALWPNDYVTLGHALLSEFREYERGTTASVNAAVQPILDRYVRRLQGELEAQGFKRDLLVMNGNGGTVAARLVAREAAKTIMSGPASGVMAAAATLAQSGVANAITYDMGGTSTDVALIHGGVPQVSSEITVAYGLPIHVPMVDVRSVGAGGGSIASIDAAGMLQVGPQSAGSEPGPICYGRGGTEPTVTDANLVLGRLDPERLLAVARPVTVAEVREVVRREARQAARHRRRCGGGGRDPARQHAHGRRHPHGVAGARARSARLHPVRLRRRRAAARGGAGARARASPRCWCRRGRASPMRWAAWSPTCARTSSTRSTCRSMAPTWARCRRSSPQQRERGVALNAEEQSEIVETDRAARRRHAVPRPDPPDPRRAARRRRLARGAAGLVRGRLFRALPGAAAGDQGGAGQPHHLGDRPAPRLSALPR